jgi:molecular chaperone GrpE (heat shock protein)
VTQDLAKEKDKYLIIAKKFENYKKRRTSKERA